MRDRGAASNLFSASSLLAGGSWTLLPARGVCIARKALPGAFFDPLTAPMGSRYGRPRTPPGGGGFVKKGHGKVFEKETSIAVFIPPTMRGAPDPRPPSSPPVFPWPQDRGVPGGLCLDAPRDGRHRPRPRRRLQQRLDGNPSHLPPSQTGFPSGKVTPALMEG